MILFGGSSGYRKTTWMVANWRLHPNGWLFVPSFARKLELIQQFHITDVEALRIKVVTVDKTGF